MQHTKFRESACRFWRRRFFKVFTIYGRGGHLGHVTWTIYTNFRSPFPRRLHIKFGFDWPSGFGGEDVSYKLTGAVIEKQVAQRATMLT